MSCYANEMTVALYVHGNDSPIEITGAAAFAVKAQLKARQDVSFVGNDGEVFVPFHAVVVAMMQFTRSTADCPEDANCVTGKGNLYVTKFVSGDEDTPATFTISVTLGNTDIAGTYGDAEFEAGVASLSLKHGEQAAIIGLPVGTTYTIAEESETGYTSEISGSTGTIGEQASIATVVNTVTSV